MTVEFSVEGSPLGKGRPNFARTSKGVTTYTPQKTSDYEELIKMEYVRQSLAKHKRIVRFEDNEPLEMQIDAYYKIPKSSKTKHAQMLDQTIKPTKKPDVDNIFKIVADGLNKLAYKDDAQIVRGIITKYYSDNPRIVVRIRTIE